MIARAVILCVSLAIAGAQDVVVDFLPTTTPTPMTSTATPITTTAAAITTTAGLCGDGFQVYGENCYLYVQQKASWNDAQEMCSGYQAFLAEPVTAGQNAFVKKLSDMNGGTRVWLGATNDQGGAWYWATSGEPFAYSDWGNGQPDNVGGEHCMEYSTGHWHKWNDDTCGHAVTYICQKPLADDPGVISIGK